MRPLRDLFRTEVQKQARSADRWIDVFPATIGKADGTVLTSTAGIIWVQNIINGQEYEVHNTLAPTDRIGLHVLVGRQAGDKDLRIKEVSKAYGLITSQGQTASGAVNDHFIDRDHFLPFLVAPTDDGGLVVQIYGDTIIKADGTFGYIASQTLDLASHVPATGALYVLLEADDDGVIYATDGTPVDALELLTPADIPAITSGRHPSCAVRLYAGQTQLYRDPDSVNDFVDVRALTSGGGGDVVYVRKFVDQPAAPTVDDDIDAGYLATDLWVYDSGYGPEVYICQDNAAGAADWLQLGTGGVGAVDSVNGQTGVVVLDPDNLDDTATTNKFTDAADIAKLAGIETDAQVNIQADWSETDTSEDSYIQNKPTVPVKATGAEVNTGTDDAKFITAKAVADSRLVSGPSFSEVEMAAFFDGSTGKLLKDMSLSYTSINASVLRREWEVIEYKILAADGIFDFQSILHTYKGLEILFNARSDRAGTSSDSVKIKFNNDAGNNYVGMIQWGAGQQEQATAGAPFQFTFITGDTSPASWFNNSKITIFDYANTNIYKSYQARGMQAITNAAGNYFIYDGMGIWLSTAAINQITIYPGVGTNFKINSTAVLIGLR